MFFRGECAGGCPFNIFSDSDLSTIGEVQVRDDPSDHQLPGCHRDVGHFQSD